MTFEEALKAMRKGKGAKFAPAPHWYSVYYIREGVLVYDAYHKVKHPEDKNWSWELDSKNNQSFLESPHILYDKWEIVDDMNIGDQCARPFDETTNAFYFKYKDEIIRVWKSDFYSYFKK